MSERKTYIELKVPIRKSVKWMESMRQAFKGKIDVRWQYGYYHVTLAFINSIPDSSQVIKIGDKYFTGAEAPTVTFDKLDVFKTPNSKQLVIHLATSDVPQSIQNTVASIRKEIVESGGILSSDFKFHVTLGRVDVSGNTDVALKQVSQILLSIELPPFQLKLTDVCYMQYKEHRCLHNWRCS